jgi:hypothetical protein
MQCYNITFFLRLPVLRATEQGASQGSYSPTAPRRSHKKPGFFPLREAEGCCEEVSDLQAMAGETARAGELAHRFEGIEGRNRRKQC